MLKNIRQENIYFYFLKHYEIFCHVFKLPLSMNMHDKFGIDIIPVKF